MSFGLLQVFHTELVRPTQNLELNTLFDPGGYTVPILLSMPEYNC